MSNLNACLLYRYRLKDLFSRLVTVYKEGASLGEYAGQEY